MPDDYSNPIISDSTSSDAASDSKRPRRCDGDVTVPAYARSPSDKLAFGLPEAGRLLGLGRTSLYMAINAGELHAIKAGRRTLIRRQDLETYLATRPAALDHSGERSRSVGSKK